ncbi:hypothetical protein Vadar_018460 [Vaccinium darrowii]|uniref:Uncharacterized protein n=1 Tax=Vaccinium darrowii TaxID=229202 RepID=A0ACB7YE67_9ERIC|nr:hypothetical protein Vadar_018460 [Vaccinium darrowii]
MTFHACSNVVFIRVYPKAIYEFFSVMTNTCNKVYEKLQKCAVTHSRPGDLIMLVNTFLDRMKQAFFCERGDYDSYYGHFFHHWYAQSLIDHADNVLSLASLAFEDTRIVVKEMSVQYYQIDEMAMLVKSGPDLKYIDRRVLNSAWDRGLSVAGQNAVPCYDRAGFMRIVETSKPINDPDHHCFLFCVHQQLSPFVQQTICFPELDYFIKSMHDVAYPPHVNLQPSKSTPGYDLKLEEFLGGAETFKPVLRFCHGLPISLNPNNVAALRCASEVLEMTEALEDGNLISKTEAFLMEKLYNSSQILRNSLSIGGKPPNVRRCCDSIAWKVSRENPSTRDALTEDSWWFQDTVTVRIDHFMRIITALRANGLKPEIVDSCIMYYAGKG